MRILVASAPHADTFGYSMPPPGLLRLGGELRRRGFAVALDDLAFGLANGDLPAGDGLAAACARRLLADGPPDVLGLSVMGATLPVAIRIAEAVRAEAARTRIVLGGPGTTGVDRVLLERFPCFDAVVRGEGEATLPAVLERWAQGRGLESVPGVTWRRERGDVAREPDRVPLADLAALPEYAWDLLPPLAEYKTITGEEEGLVPIDSGRGCVFDCSFCTIGRFWGRRSRPLPAERLAREVAQAGSMPGARNAYLCHDLFAADRAHAIAFCEALERAGTTVPWECRARADHLDAELLTRMAAAGCYRVLLGIESADPGVRRRASKGMRDNVDLLAAVDACADAGVAPILSLILGLPGEDELALERSLDFCADAALRAGVYLSLHLANPQPGCGLGEELAETSHPLDGIPPDMAWGAGETAPERTLIAAHPDIFSTWSLLPLPEAELRDLARLATELPEVLMRYPRTFALVRRGGGTGVEPGAGTLAVYRAWREFGRSFESFALSAGDALVEDCLLWEQALVRAAARVAPATERPAPGDAARALAEVVRVRHDLSGLTAQLIGSHAPPAVARDATCLAVAHAERGAATLRISADVARLLERLNEPGSLSELDTHPGARAALDRMAEAGLIAYADAGSPIGAP